MRINNSSTLVFEIHKGLYGKVVFTSKKYTGKDFDKMIKDASSKCVELNSQHKRIKHYYSYIKME